MTLTSLASCGVAQAGWTEFWQRFHLDCHRMRCWPEPFYHSDREAVRAPLTVMKNNGWRSQNTIDSHFFDAETQKLSKAGEL
jgi:hypothetical protein